MEYVIKLSCGHKETFEISGSDKEIRRKKQYYRKNHKCRECYKKSEDEKIQKANEGLPQLRGSEKQIVWAMQIRMFRRAELETIEYQYRVWEERFNERHDLSIKSIIDMLGKKRETYHKTLFTEDSAKWWIEKGREEWR